MRKFFLFLALLIVIGLLKIKADHYILIDNPSSLVRVGMDPHPTDSTDIALAYTLLGAIEHDFPDSIAFVRDKFLEKAQADITKDKAYSSLAFILSKYLNPELYQPNLLSDELYDYFSKNNFEKLKHYLILKYELNNYRPRSIKEFIEQRTFYEDFLMFNDPNRQLWDKTSEIIDLVPLSKGEKIIDVGTGFGYNAIQFLPRIGDSGTVYATDSEEQYIKFLQEFVCKNNITNIIPIISTSNDISVRDTVDVVFMSSLYHIIYTWSREDERTPFLKSLKKSLKQGGYLVIVDNINRHGEELNNCHVDPRLVEAQLGYWGFEPFYYKEISPQRYIFIFRHNDQYEQPNITISPDIPHLNLCSNKSIIHIGSLDSYDITDLGIDAAKYVYDFMDCGDSSLADIAIEKYNDLIPKENFGGEYTALQWLCEVKKANEHDRNEMLSDPLSRSFYHKMTDDSCKVIRYYLLHKYKLESDSIRMLSDSILEKSGEVGRTHRSYLEDYILALNPKRPIWEKTDSFLSHMGIQDGDIIADIGSGSGFYSDRFSKLVGEKGKVYSVEIKDEHIQSLKDYITNENIQNIKIIKGKENVLELPEKVDKLFMCSLYHILYGVTSDKERNSYLLSLADAIKPEGELIIIDNGPVDDNTLPYHGPYISKELIITQLGFYGFELRDYFQPIPQRFMLKFKKKL